MSYQSRPWCAPEPTVSQIPLGWLGRGSRGTDIPKSPCDLPLNHLPLNPILSRNKNFLGNPLPYRSTCRSYHSRLSVVRRFEVDGITGHKRGMYKNNKI